MRRGWEFLPLHLDPAATTRSLPPVLTPWKSKWAIGGLLLLIVYGGLGWGAALEHQWRSGVIGLARSIHPRPPDENDAAFPIVLPFARFGEDYAQPVPIQGRYSEDPTIAKQRLARLLAALAAAGPNARAKAIGIDLVLSHQDAVDPYLATVLAELGNVVLAVTDAVDPEGHPITDGPNPVLAASAALVGADFHLIPHWINPAAAVRLRAPVETSLGVSGEGAALFPGLAAAVHLVASGQRLDPKRFHRDGFPIHYWNLHYPTSADATSGSGEVVRLLDLWPSSDVAGWVQSVPLWEDGELPTAWLTRVRAMLSDKEVGAYESPRDRIERLFSGRILLVGVGYPDDLATTPFSSLRYAKAGRQQARPPRTPGVVIHAQAVATLQKSMIPTEVGILAQFLLLVCTSVIGWVIGMGTRGILGIGALAAAGLVVAGIDLLLVTFGNIWLPTMTLLVPLGVFQVAGGLEQTRLLRESRARVQKWVQRLMPTSSASVITEEEAGLLGVMGYASESAANRIEWRTVLRTDLAGYTVLNRELDRRGRSDLMVILMSDFFRRAIGAVEASGGQLTDLTGDGLVAVFDKPEASRQSQQAVEAGRRIRVVAGEWREAAKQRLAAETGLEDVPLPGIRIAIGASETSFQFVGTEAQQRTLFFGGAFILSARIEAAIKRLPVPAGANQLGRCCIHESVVNHLDIHATSLKRHDPVSVQGLDQPLTVFELLD